LKSDQTLVYILTLGVVDAYRNCGIGGVYFPSYKILRLLITQ
jgi:hypothetical protein